MQPLRTRWPARARRAVSVVALLAAASPPLAAQLPDPYVVPRGALRVGFDPQWTSWAELFSVGGTRIPLGAYYSADALGTSLLPTLADARDAIRSITGDGQFTFNAGAFRTTLDADIRRFPFTLAVGLSSRLTLEATVPLVTTRVKSAASVDSTTSDAGWNPASTQAPVGAFDSLTTLLADLDASAALVEAGIAAGSYGCPTGPTCDEARDLVTTIRALAADLRVMTGFDAVVSGSGIVPPFSPTATSTAGQAVLQAVADVDARLAALGEAPLTATLPLPTVPVGTDAMDPVLGEAQFGYSAASLNPGETIKLSGLGDIELGLRYAVAQGAAFRAVLGALVRLPTGKKQDDPDDYVDIAPADGQLDIGLRLDGAFEPGSAVGIWFSGGYLMQFGDRIIKRVRRADQPIVPISQTATVERNLGDEFRASVHPALRLAPGFRVFVSAGYYRRLADRYTLAGTTVPELEALTAMTLWTVGGGVWYRMERNRRAFRLPVEAGFHYDTALSGDGGTAPKGGRMSLSLRFFYNLWGSQPVEAAGDEGA